MSTTTTTTTSSSSSSRPFPTFLYTNEPPPLTSRNKQRVRPSPEQLAELKAVYAMSPHPPRRAREALGRQIGMRYQSVTNWFQNQRSTAKRRNALDSPPPVTSSSSSPTTTMSMSTTHSYSLRRSPSPSYYSPSPSPSPPITVTTTRRDPVKDIIVAQAAARQQLHELALPLSGASIVPATSYPSSSSSSSSSSSAPSTDAPNTPTTILNISLPNTTTPSSLSRAHTPPALLSSFQLSRTSSPSPTHLWARHTFPPYSHSHSANPHHAHPNLPPGVILTCDASSSAISVSTTDSAAVAAAASSTLLLDQVPRGKRSRPTPSQLIALRRLHALTDSPTIEERIQLGNEIGMELGKVTNWFRNLRQTARKKEKRAREEGSVNRAQSVAPSVEAVEAERDAMAMGRKRARLEEYTVSPVLLSPSSSPSGSSSSSYRTRSSFGSEYGDRPPVDQLEMYHNSGDHLRGRDVDLAGVHSHSRSHSYRDSYDDHEHEHEHADHHSTLSETDSTSTTHEAVTPPPQAQSHPLSRRDSPALSTSAPMEVDEEEQGGLLREREREGEKDVHMTPKPRHADVDVKGIGGAGAGEYSGDTSDPSVDDAMLLLAFRERAAVRGR